MSSAVLHEGVPDAAFMGKPLKFIADRFGNLRGNLPDTVFTTLDVENIISDTKYGENPMWCCIRNPATITSTKEPGSVTFTSPAATKLFLRLLKNSAVSGLPCSVDNIVQVKFKFSRASLGCFNKESPCCEQYWFCQRRFHPSNNVDLETGRLIATEKALREPVERVDGQLTLGVLFKVKFMVVKGQGTQYTLYVTAGAVIGGFTAPLVNIQNDLVIVSEEELDNIQKKGNFFSAAKLLGNNEDEGDSIKEDGESEIDVFGEYEDDENTIIDSDQEQELINEEPLTQIPQSPVPEKKKQVQKRKVPNVELEGQAPAKKEKDTSILHPPKKSGSGANQKGPFSFGKKK
jgi:hypothetical protein